MEVLSHTPGACPPFIEQWMKRGYLHVYCASPLAESIRLAERGLRVSKTRNIPERRGLLHEQTGLLRAQCQVEVTSHLLSMARWSCSSCSVALWLLRTGRPGPIQGKSTNSSAHCLAADLAPRNLLRGSQTMVLPEALPRFPQGVKPAGWPTCGSTAANVLWPSPWPEFRRISDKGRVRLS